MSVTSHPGGESILLGGGAGKVELIDIDPEATRTGRTAPRLLPGFRGDVVALAVDPSGRLAAGGAGQTNLEDRLIRLWDLEDGSSRSLELEEPEFISSLTFLSERRLASGSTSGVMLWDLDSGKFEYLLEEEHDRFQLAASPDGRLLVGVGVGPPRNRSADIRVWDLETGTSWSVTSHGHSLRNIAVSPDGRLLASAGSDGVVRVGPVTGEDPHLLLGHEGTVYDVKFSPDGQWIATAGDDTTVRLWPVPEGQPLHTLPLDELLARLRTFTNLRVVRDESQTSGFDVIAEEFPGWETLPRW